MKVVIQGLRIATGCRYIKFTMKSSLNIYEDHESDCMFIEFPKGFSTSYLVNNQVEVLSPCILKETDYIKIYNPILNINGLILKKLIQTDYVFSQFIVGDLDKFTMNFNKSHCEILIPKSLDWNIKKYLCLLEKNPYFEIKGYSKLGELNNVYSLNLQNKDLSYKSTNSFIFNTKAKYSKYLLRGIDIQDQFISQLRNRIEEYGIELLSTPIDKNTSSDNRITYRFSEIDKQESHHAVQNPLRWAMQYKAHVDFTFGTPDLSLYHDFKVRYQNLDLITNYTEFYTLDKLGRSWVSNIEWSNLDASFNQDYATDEHNNIAFSTSFSADIHYYIVYDETFYRFNNVILSILGSNIGSKSSDLNVTTV